MKSLSIIALTLGLIFISYLYYSKEAPITSKTSISSDPERNKVSSLPLKIKTQTINDNTVTQKKLDETYSSEHDKNLLPSSITSEESRNKIPYDIKEKICQKSSNEFICVINLDSHYANDIFTEEGNILSDEVSTILASKNFNEVLTDLASKKIISKSFHNEANYNDKLAELTAKVDVSSNGVSCDDKTCGLIVQGRSEESLNEFRDKFMKGDSKGNYFISIQVNEIDHVFEQRILFFPGNSNAIISRVKPQVE